MAEKPHMNLVFIGHIDHGKSTTVGRLLLDSGAISPHIIEKFKKEAEERGKGGFEFAYVMDGLKEERERGVTIDVAHKRFDTDKYYFTIIDAPGHRDFIKNMITGTSQADAAVLTVAAPEGIMAQTKEHIFLAKVLGVDQVIVGLNKMDATQPAFSEEQYNKVLKSVKELTKMVGFREDKLQFVPYAALTGDNIAGKSENMAWYKGPTLLDCLNKLEQPSGATNLPLRLPIQDVYNISGIGAVPVGRVETGALKPGDNLIFKPSAHQGGKVGEVKSIEMHHEMVPTASAGDNVGFNVRGIGKKDIRRGDVAGPSDNPPKVARKFKAQIMVLDHPSVIAPGYTPVFHCHTSQVACQFEQLLAKLDPKTGAVVEENPDFLKRGDAGIVMIKPTKPMVIEEQKEFPQLSRFAIRDMGSTVAAGMCMKVEEEWD